jgi:hypothetical protein
MPNRKLTLIVPTVVLLMCSCTSSKTAGNPRIKPVSLDTILSCANDPIITKVFATDLATMRKLVEVAYTAYSVKNANDPVLIRDAGFIPMTQPNSDLHFWVLVNGSRGYGQTYSPGGYCQDALRSTEYPVDSDKALPESVRLEGKFFDLDTTAIFHRANEFTFESEETTDIHSRYLLAKRGQVTLRLEATRPLLRLHTVLIDRADSRAAVNYPPGS